MSVKSIASAVFMGALLSASVAQANLVTNGDFNSTVYNHNTEFGTPFGGQYINGWTGNNGYNLFFTSAAASTTVNSYGQFYGSGAEKLWGPVAASPGGGSFIALDGEQRNNVQGAISQTIHGLVAGLQYLLSFDWGAGQVQSRTGPTTEAFQASLGGQSFETAVASNASQSFSGWMHQVFTFTATGTSEVLSFLSVGTPEGLPPMATLDDVSLVAVPEPVSLALLGAGLVGLGVVRRRRKH